MDMISARKQKLPLVLFLLSLIFFTHRAFADKELKFEKAIFYGSSGDQMGKAIEFRENRLHVAGSDASTGSKALALSYLTPATDQPLNKFVWTDEQKTAISVFTTVSDLAVTGEGLYFAGSSLATFSGKKATKQLSGVLAKFPLGEANTGAPLWIVRTNEFPERKEEVLRAAIGADEQSSTFIYATGHASSRANNVTAFLEKYDATGRLIWAKLLGSPEEAKKSSGTGLAALNGFIYAAGFTSPPDATDKYNALPLNPTLWKFDPSGKQMWVKSTSTRLYSVSDVNDIEPGLKVDVAASDDGIYLTSGKKATSKEGDVLFQKYNQNGDLIWETGWSAKERPGAANTDSKTFVLSAGKDRLYVAGYTEYSDKKIPGKDEDAFLLEVDKIYGSVLAAHSYGERDRLENVFGITMAGTDIYLTGVRKPRVDADKKKPLGDTDLMLLRFSALPVTTVNIDVEPGSSQNAVLQIVKQEEIKSKDKKKKTESPKEKDIVVAIYSNKAFDAATQVDLPSLTFGRTGFEASWVGCVFKDENQDGSADLVCNFKTSWNPWKEAKPTFVAGDTEGILRGQTISGNRIIGKDMVRTGPPSVETPAPTPEPVPSAPAPAIESLISQSAPTTSVAAPTTTIVGSTPTVTDTTSTTAPVPATSEPAPIVSTTTSIAPLVSQPTPTVATVETTTPTSSTSKPSIVEPAPITSTTSPITSTTSLVSEPVSSVAIANPLNEVNETVESKDTTSSPVVTMVPLATTTAGGTTKTALYDPVIQKATAPPLIFTSQTAVPQPNSLTPSAPRPALIPPQSPAATAGFKAPISSMHISSELSQPKPSMNQKPPALVSRELESGARAQELQARAQELEAAVQTESEKIESGSGLAQAYADSGKEAFQKGNLTAAVAHFTEALKLDPYSPELRTDLGLALVQQGNLEEAATQFSEALKLNPNDVKAREQLDAVLSKLSESKKAAAQVTS